jgi:hypothetical protein
MFGYYNTRQEQQEITTIQVDHIKTLQQRQYCAKERRKPTQYKARIKEKRYNDHRKPE